jgi:hypothetical protein
MILCCAVVPMALAQPQPTLFHVAHDTYGCVSPRATSAITNTADPRHSDPGWVRFVTTDGGCAPITPRSQWRLVFRQGDLAYVTYAGTTGLPGSYYLRADELVEIAATATTGIGGQSIPGATTRQQPSQGPQTAQGVPSPTGGYYASPDTRPAPPATGSPEIPPTGHGEPGSMSPPLDRRSGSRAPASSGYIDPPEARLPTSPRSPETTRTPAPLPEPTSSMPAATPQTSGGPRAIMFGLAGAIAVIWLLSRRRKPSARIDTRVADLPPRPVAPHQTTSPTRTPAPSLQPRPPPVATSPQIRSLATKVTWYAPGQQATVAGHTIAGGMVYLGSRHPSAPHATACFIDSALPVATRDADKAGAEMGYWPSYADIGPRCRLAYLQWLAGGKRDPDGYIGYVFLYFYGLERRLFVDRVDGAEAAALVTEVERLRSIYAANRSFAGYSRGLLDALEISRLVTNPAALFAFKPDLGASANVMALPLKLAIAARVSCGEPLFFELAMAGVIGLPSDIFPADRRVLEHARPQLLELMRPAFAKAFPAGFNLRNRKDSSLQLQHRCATAGLVVDIGTPGGVPLPDPATLTWTKLVNLVVPIASQLDGFAKLIAYHPARAASLASLSTLPPVLRKVAADGPAREAAEWLRMLPKPIAAVPVHELAFRALGKPAGKWTPGVHRAAADVLAASFYGIEPATLPSPNPAGEAIVFLFPDPDAGAQRSAAYEAAAAGAEIVSAIGRLNPAATGRVEEVWLQSVSEKLQLEQTERTRLAARLRWLAGTKTSLARIKGKLADTSHAHREAIAWSAAAAAAASGIAAPAQVAVLEKVYDRLGLARSELYSTLHGASAGAAIAADEPVTVETGTGERLHGIPAAPVNAPLAPPSGPLDEERIRRIRAETEQVSSVLADVFAEDEPEPTLSSAGAENSEADLPGLDGAHAKLVRLLSGTATWSRIDFEAAAGTCGLFPDGALETINEWAFDHFDEPLVEEGDPLVVNTGLLGTTKNVADAA